MKILPKKVNHLIGQAMHRYSMLTDGDKILIAVSGGVDSLFLAYALSLWQKKAPIRFDLQAVHLDMGFEVSSHEAVSKEMQKVPIPLSIEKTSIGMEAEKQAGERGCFFCARNRRKRLFEIARERGCTKLALGHHKDDLIETFFLNIFYSGNISTMVPNQPLFDGRLQIIRPLALLEKEQIISTAQLAGLKAVKNPCPMADHSKRQELRNFLEALFAEHPAYKSNVFAALGNVRQEYLL